jgi:hypothetical protein
MTAHKCYLFAKAQSSVNNYLSIRAVAVIDFQ